MHGPQRPAQDTARQAARWRRRILGGAVLAMLVAVALLGRGSVAGWARRSAAGHLEAGAIGAAERSLAWADWVLPGDYRTDLLQAGCLRRLGEIDAWRSALESAERGGAPLAEVQLERALGNFRWGQVPSVSAEDYDALVSSGSAPREAIHAVVHGLLAKGEREKAQQFIELWATDPADELEASFLRGVCWWSAGKLELAQAEFEKVLARQAGHDRAHAGLARLLEDQQRFTLALPHDAWLVQSAPDRESARVDLARILRKLGRTQEAREALAQPALATEVSTGVALELAELEFECGNYEAARRWFQHANLERQHLPETLRAAACNEALLGDAARAGQLLGRIDDPQGLTRRLGELKRRLAIEPNDFVAASELQRLLDRPPAQSQSAVESSSPVQVSALYGQHCAGCHGADGQGDGRAARHLHPRPRNLRTGEYRLISTPSHVPTREDIERVIREGIPGASMPAFKQLSDAQRQQLALDVERLYRQRYPAATEPGGDAEILSVPSLGNADADSIARGRATYFKSGCQQCHGDDGIGSAAPAMYDDEGRPTTPRNLVRDPMKGGSGAESLYRRIRLGMPGTPHPASPVLKEAEVVALVHFCRSLAQSPQLTLTNHEREMRDARK